MALRLTCPSPGPGASSGTVLQGNQTSKPEVGILFSPHGRGYKKEGERRFLLILFPTTKDLLQELEGRSVECITAPRGTGSPAVWKTGRAAAPRRDTKHQYCAR